MLIRHVNLPLLSCKQYTYFYLLSCKILINSDKSSNLSMHKGCMMLVGVRIDFCNEFEAIS
jgi:hypothetical protein